MSAWQNIVRVKVERDRVILFLDPTQRRRKSTHYEARQLDPDITTKDWRAMLSVRMRDHEKEILGLFKQRKNNPITYKELSEFSKGRTEGLFCYFDSNRINSRFRNLGMPHRILVEPKKKHVPSIDPADVPYRIYKLRE